MKKRKWSREIIDQLELVNKGEKDLDTFVSECWERFKPVYINYHRYCEDEGDLYLLVHSFFSKILRADVQPLFNSDNQLFNYFKTAVRYAHYDKTHKKELKTVPLHDILIRVGPGQSPNDNLESKIPDESPIFTEFVESESRVEYLISELSKTLGDRYIKLLILLYRDDMSPKDARKALGVSLTTVRDRIGVIRKALSELMENENK